MSEFEKKLLDLIEMHNSLLEDIFIQLEKIKDIQLSKYLDE